ncbi:MAG: hypothetical protein AAFU78_22510 [Cyanobacteria bacterium J06633_2]
MTHFWEQQIDLWGQRKLNIPQQRGLIHGAISELYIDYYEGESKAFFGWSYRCLESWQYSGGENGFSSPFHALVHFTATILSLDDEILFDSEEEEEILYDD